MQLTHEQAVTELRDAAFDLERGAITRAQWCDRVALTMWLRYPDDPDLRRMHALAHVAPGLAPRMSTPSGSQPPAAA